MQKATWHLILSGGVVIEEHLFRFVWIGIYPHYFVYVHQVIMVIDVNIRANVLVLQFKFEHHQNGAVHTLS